MVFRAVVMGEDYAPEAEKNLKELRRKANVPGFRPGMVPAGMIEKMYGKGVRAEQAYRKAHEAVYKHIGDKELEVMGDVMPSELQGEMSFEQGATEHEFVFEVGVAPKVDVDVSGAKLTRYTIKPSKEMKERVEKSEGKVTEEMLEADLARESDFLLTLQLKNLILEKAGLKLPEDFLKRWLFAVNEGKFTMEDIEKDFAGFLRMMAWNLILRYYSEKLGIEVTKEDVEAEAEEMARMQFAQYGMTDVPEETLKGFAGTMLENREQAQQVFEKVREDKVLGAIRPTLKIAEKSVSVEEFQKVASEVNS